MAKPKKKAFWIPFPNKAHQYKKLGVIAVGSKEGFVTHGSFDCRYTSNRSKFGKALAQLQSEGIDISNITKSQKLSKQEQDLVITVAQRLYEVIGNRTKVIDRRTPGSSLSSTSLKKDETFDWTKPCVKYSRYYKMAEHLLKHNDPALVMNVVDIITGYK